MRIAIDARLNAYRRGGIPQYTRQLLTALADIALEEQLISLQHRDMLRPLAVAPNVSRRTIYTPPHHRFEPWILPLEVSLARPDVLHFPDFVAPVFRPCPAVVTIHDLAFMHYPKILDDAAREYYSQVLTNTPRADAVIAVSEATRQDVAQFLDIPIETIHVIYEAAAPMFRRMDMRPGEARVLNGTPVAADTFMLFVSTLEPRKNLPTLLEALRICLDRRPERLYKLVIVGGRGWNDQPIFDAIRDLRLSDHLLLAGSVGQYDLRWLYNACQFYINPSLYEGFGLPLLEAMACGAACLAAATSSLPEIGGDAAVYVPPLEPQQWADAIEELWDNTARQQELGRIGQARSQRFSWARTARETLSVYHQVAHGRTQPARSPASAGPPARRTALPPQPAVVLPTPGVSSDGARNCLRCATAMLPGELQQHLRIQLANEDGDETPVLPRAWACPNCGYAELVVEPLVVPFADAVAAMPSDAAALLMPDAAPVQDEYSEKEPPPVEAPTLAAPDWASANAVDHSERLDAPEPQPAPALAAPEPAQAEDAAAPEAVELADAPSAYETALLPALDRRAEEDAAAPEPAHADEPSAYETALLPALAVDPDDTTLEDETVQRDAPMDAAEPQHADAALVDEAEPEYAAAEAAELEAEQPELTALASDDHEHASADAHHINGLLPADPPPQHPVGDSANGGQLASPAPRAKPGKRSTTSAKLSRAAARHNDANEQPDAAPSRRSKRARRNK